MWDKEVTNDMPIGSHLMTTRNGYYHHGIYIGVNRVIHYSGFCSGVHSGPVEELSLEEFSAGRPIRVKAIQQAKYSREEIVRRAMSRVGENRYRLLTNNCEHFCNWCLWGKSYSEQVRSFIIHPFSTLRLLLQNLPMGAKKATAV